MISKDKMIETITRWLKRADEKQLRAIANIVYLIIARNKES